MIPRSTKYMITFINRGVGKMISEKEYALVKSKLMQDYKIVSDITA